MIRRELPQRYTISNQAGKFQVWRIQSGWVHQEAEFPTQAEAEKHRDALQQKWEEE